MATKKLLERIETNPQILVGKPVIKGTRLSVQFILGLLAKGSTIDEIMDEYDGIDKEDILACLSFASHALEDNSFMPLGRAA